MEVFFDFFEPSVRYQEQTDHARDDQDDDDGPIEETIGDYTEVQLTVSVEVFQSNYCWDWEALRAYCSANGAMSTILWITENTFLCVVIGNGFYFYNDEALMRFNYTHATFQDSGGQEQTIILAHRVDHHERHETSIGEAGAFWRAIITSNGVALTIVNDSNCMALPSGPLLSHFLRGSPSLQVLEFEDFYLGEEHCRALAGLVRTDIKIKFKGCSLEPQDAEDNSFFEWFRSNQVVTEIFCYRLGSRILSALSGNRYIKKFMIGFCSSELGKEEMYALLEPLSGNIGIEHLTIQKFEVASDEIWILLFRSLSTHPSMKLLSLPEYMPFYQFSAGSKAARMNAIVQMLQINTVVHTIELPDAFSDEEVYQNSILPRLEMNRSLFEVQRQAVKRADSSIRPQLLGRALHVVKCNSDLVFRFLSENVPAFVGPAE
jgi:hypothetical protein